MGYFQNLLEKNPGHFLGSRNLVKTSIIFPSIKMSLPFVIGIKNGRFHLIAITFITRSYVVMSNLNFDACLKHFCKILAGIITFKLKVAIFG